MVRWSGKVQLNIRWASGDCQISIWAWHWWTWNLFTFEPRTKVLSLVSSWNLSLSFVQSSNNWSWLILVSSPFSTDCGIFSEAREMYVSFPFPCVIWTRKIHNPKTAQHRCRTQEAMIVIVLLNQLVTEIWRNGWWKAKLVIPWVIHIFCDCRQLCSQHEKGKTGYYLLHRLGS